MLKYTILLMLLIPAVLSMKGQIAETKTALSVSGGKLIYGDTGNPFFPGRMNNSGFSVSADYLRTVLPWMKIGLEGSLLFPGLPDQGPKNFIKVSSQDEKLITAGVNATFFTPYKEAGWRNRIRFQLGVAPVMVLHQGTRTVSIDNTVERLETNQQEFAGIEMKGPSMRLGWSITPAMECYLEQHIGIRVSLNSLFTSLQSDRSTERTTIHSLNFGFFVPLSRNE